MGDPASEPDPMVAALDRGWLAEDALAVGATEAAARVSGRITPPVAGAGGVALGVGGGLAGAVAIDEPPAPEGVATG